MDDLDQAFTKLSKQGEKESANRKLRRLRIVLILWIILLFACIIWFSL